MMGINRIFLWAPARSGHNFIGAMLMSWGIKTEDIDSNPNIDTTGGVFTIFVVRDLYNWAASILKMVTDRRGIYEYNNWPLAKRAYTTWISIFLEYKGLTNIVPNKFFIEYERFRDSREYRQQICKQLGGVYNEDLIDIPFPIGRGSSFDGESVKGTKLKTDERYKWWVKHPNKEYRKAYQDFLNLIPDARLIYDKNK